MDYTRKDNTIVLRLEKGEQINASLLQLAEKENITCASITGIGAAGKVTLGFFTPETKEYKEETFEGDFEICPLAGNLTTKDGKPYIHCHINLGDSSFNCFGGHLKEATISVTCEIILTITPTAVERTMSEDIGINLMEFSADNVKKD